MASLTTQLKSYLATELKKAIGSSPDQSLRVLFAAPEYSQLVSLYNELKADDGGFLVSVSGKDLSIPVHLLSETFSGHSDNMDGIAPDQLVKLRNSSVKIFLVLQEVGAQISQSSTTTSEIWGVDKIFSEFDKWVELPVIQYLIEQYASKSLLPANKSTNAELFKFALKNAWLLDDIKKQIRMRSETWSLIENVFNSAHGNQEPHALISSQLGLVYCQAIVLGTPDHLKLNDSIAKFLNNGLSKGFEELRHNAAEIESAALHDFEQHLLSQGVYDAAEFYSNPNKFYTPLLKTDGTPEDWWVVLDTVVWTRLLDSIEPDKLKTGLVVALQNQIAVTAKSLPAFTQDHVELTVVFNDSLSEKILTDSSIKIERVVGLKKGFDEIETVESADLNNYKFVDMEIPPHDKFLRYRVTVDDLEPVIVKIIVLDQYEAGLIALARNSTKTTLFKKLKKKKKKNGVNSDFESNIQLSSLGQHSIQFFTSSHLSMTEKIEGYEVDAEKTDGVAFPINQISKNSFTALIDSDEECHYLFDVISKLDQKKSNYKINLTADDISPSGAKSEFDLLIKINSSGSKKSSLRVETAVSRLSELEVWILENENSFKPIVLGPDYRAAWVKLDWRTNPVLSQMEIPIDSRPAMELSEGYLAFLSARKKVFGFIRPGVEDRVPALSEVRLYDSMKDPLFVEAVTNLLTCYISWLRSDYQTAAWCDLVCIHTSQSNNQSLKAVPDIVLMSPYHPLRLAWQCCAQKTLKDAIDIGFPCPAASVLSPATFPDCFILPCKTAASSNLEIPLVSLACSSDYWQALGATQSDVIIESVDTLDIFDVDFGIEIDGLSKGFNSQQVGRALSEVHKLKSGKSTLNISISSDQGRSSSCNEGVTNWCSKNLGELSDEWFMPSVGSSSINIIDQRNDSQYPEQSTLSSLTNSTSSTVRWSAQDTKNVNQNFDLSIIAQLGTLNKSFDTQGIRSAIDITGLTRWRVRKQLQTHSTFIAESRIGTVPKKEFIDTGLAAQLLDCVDEIENRTRDHFDSYIFSPNMQDLQKAIDVSNYTAISSSGIDASCFFGATQKAFLWDYELPSYSQRAGENSGYYLLAQESDGIKTAVRSALSSLGNQESLNDAEISKILLEISRRGMPTLKGLTSGGTESLGEIGMLIALRILQADFEEDIGHPALLPTQDGETVNLVVSVDPFRRYFDDLKSALNFPHGDRPDLLVFSIRFVNGEPKSLKLTPIEVKVRSDQMNPKKRSEHLKQASHFSMFLDTLSSKARENNMWGIAWRNLLATLLDYGFRIYGQLDIFLSKDWAVHHTKILQSLSHEDMTIEFDRRGRLILIDKGHSGAFLDSDGDGFDETLRISHAEALSILNRDTSHVAEDVKNMLADWELKSTASESSGHIQVDIDNPRVPPKMKKPTVEEPIVNPPDRPQPSLTENPNRLQDKKEGDGGENTKVSGEPETGIKFDVGVTSRALTEATVSFSPGNTALTQLNTGIVGDLGTGKTQLIQALILQLTTAVNLNRGSSPNILIFDYKKDYCKDDFIKATGAKVVSPRNIPLNLFDTRDSQLDKKFAQNERFKFFTDVLDKIYSNIGPVQRQRIKEAVKQAYASSERLGRPAPTLDDVFSAYKNDGARVDTPYGILEDLVEGEHFVSDASKAVPFSEFMTGVVVIDLYSIGADDRTKNMLVVIFLNMFYEHMLKIDKKPFLGSDPQSRFVDSMLLVDEADNIMKYEFDVLKKILLQGREFGVGVILASQYLSHFNTKHENYIEPLLTWFIHKVPNVTPRQLEQIGLTDVTSDITDSIKSLKQHECLYKTFDINGKFIRAHPFFELNKGH